MQTEKKDNSEKRLDAERINSRSEKTVQRNGENNLILSVENWVVFLFFLTVLCSIQIPYLEFAHFLLTHKQ